MSLQVDFLHCSSSYTLIATEYFYLSGETNRGNTLCPHYYTLWLLFGERYIHYLKPCLRVFFYHISIIYTLLFFLHPMFVSLTHDLFSCDFRQ